MGGDVLGEKSFFPCEKELHCITIVDKCKQLMYIIIMIEQKEAEV